MNIPPIDYSRKWYTLIAVGSGLFLSTIDSSIVNIALPTMVKEFEVPLSTIQWVTLSYLLTITTLMLAIGRLADIKGKKPIYALGFIIFVLGSLLCGLSPTVYWLIAFRILQAVGAVMIMALGMGIVTEAFPPGERGMALGITGAIVSTGIILGPTLGGFIIDALDWHWIFFVNVPVGVIGVCMVFLFVPAIKPAGGQKFDYRGAAVLLLSLLSLLFALTLGQQLGFADLRIRILFLSWILLTILFIRIEHTSSHPMIDLQLFSNPVFTSGLITGFLTFTCMAGTIFLMPFFLENVLDYSIRQIGLLLGVVPLAMGIMAPISGSLSDRYGSFSITVIGLAFLVGGYFSLTTLSQYTTSLGYILRFLPIGIGTGIFQSPNNSAIMGSAPRSRLGIVSGILSITRTLGQTTGIAALGAIWASRVNQLTPHLNTSSIDAPASIQVAALQDTFVVTVVIMSAALSLAVYRWVTNNKTISQKNESPESASIDTKKMHD